VAFASATQDIALDAYRIESAPTERQAALAATYQTGYRLAMIWAGAGVLWIAARAEVANAALYQHQAWQTAYLVMAASMLVGVVTVLLSPEPAHATLAPARNIAQWLQDALVAPFADFLGRYRWQAVLILGLIALYRISQPLLCGHGLHQGRGGRSDQGLRRHHDAGRRLHRRRVVDARGRDARADARRHPQRRQQPAVRLALRPRP
jgi:hypothetical protein